ncbi:GNAT family N-acetyltransferase [Mycobacterium sp. pUA109]|uniref:GNAT family N-acetyltransferase n=1 Tax=Mycobacterium sp. pUA109 TaxID=3238982 RepID=UPI00351AF138
MSIEVRPARKADIRPLSKVLGRAFHDDPVSMWLLPNEGSRVARQSRMFAALTRHQHFAAGGVQVACDGATIGAAALWDPPNRWQQPRQAELRMIPALIGALGPRAWPGRVLTDLMKREHPEEPHWYLAVIGSDTAVRGRGFGQALMRSGLARCDADHAPAYLESSKADNVPYYQRFGFDVTGEIVVPGGGPTLWKMWRAPR